MSCPPPDHPDAPPSLASLAEGAGATALSIEVLNTEPTVLRIDTSRENGAVVDFTLSGATPAARAAQLKAELAANRDTSTFFKAVLSGSTVSLRPRVRYATLRRVFLQVVSGEGVFFTNLAGGVVGTTPVPVESAYLGTRLRLKPGLYPIDDGGIHDGRIVIDTPDFVLEGGPNVIIQASSKGVFQVEAEGFRCKGVQFLWQDEGGEAPEVEALCLMAASDWQFEDCEFVLDGVGADATCAAIWCDQLTAVYPEHRSHAYRRMKLLGCSFYLGNNTIGVYANSVFDVDVSGCLFTSLFGRTNAFGDGAKALYDAPRHALWIVNSDYINLRDNSVLNIGGHASGTNSPAAVLVERTGSGHTGANEGGHLTIRDGRFHGTVDHYAAQIALRNLWFARISGVEFHRHQVERGTTHPPAETACVSIRDCAQTLVQGCEFFNLGADGGDYARYPALGVLSLADPVSALSGDASKLLRVHGCTLDNKVAATEGGLANAHPFVQYFNTAHGHRYDLLDVSDNTLLSGGWASARFTVLDNANLAVGEGFELVVPADAFGPGAPASTTTITVAAGVSFDVAAPADGAHGTARAIAAQLEGDAGFAAHFRAMVGESVYQASGVPGAGATVLIECRSHGAAAHAVTVEHLSSVSGTTSLSVGRDAVTAVPEGATANLAGGYGDAADTGQTAVVLQDPFTSGSPADLGTVGPKQAIVSGNTFRGWYRAVSGVAAVDHVNSVPDANVLHTTTGE